MRKILIYLLLPLFSCAVVAQGGFDFIKGTKESISFDSSSNLIIIPATVNGTELNFLLDTGSAKSVIFDITNIDSLNIKKGRVLKYRGLGSNVFFEAYYSPDNDVRIGAQLMNSESEILIMVNKDYSVTDRLGINVNGIIGADLFKNFVVEIDYFNERIHFYKNNSKLPKRLREANYVDIEIINNKPYINTLVSNKSSKVSTSLLIDSGSSDALLLHSMDSTSFDFPDKGFEDYLGYGLTGDLYGIRSKVDAIHVSSFILQKTTVSFPHLLKADSLNLRDQSNGSIGGEILRRFKVVFDYKNKRVAFYPNSYFKDGFYYNMSGLQLKTEGADLQVYKDDKRWSGARDSYKKHEGQVTINSATTITYKMIPKIIVASSVKSSSGYKAGLRKGDQIIKMNGKSGEALSLNTANSFFYKNPYSNLRITYKRDGKEYDVKVPLKPVIE